MIDGHFCATNTALFQDNKKPFLWTLLDLLAEHVPQAHGRAAGDSDLARSQEDQKKDGEVERPETTAELPQNYRRAPLFGTACIKGWSRSICSESSKSAVNLPKPRSAGNHCWEPHRPYDLLHALSDCVRASWIGVMHGIS